MCAYLELYKHLCIYIISFILDYKHAGFKNQLVTCCGYGGKYNFESTLNCGGSVVVNGTQIPVVPCKHPHERLSWDGIHYTEGADKVTYEYIASGAFSDPPNVKPNTACHKF